MIWSLTTILYLISAMLNNFTGQIFHFQERTTIDMIQERGYPAETHTVTTDDGYVLALHRIPHSKTNSTASRGPVLLMHGLILSSADWVVFDNSLGFVLADAGFDVWMGNNRGNTYSRNNIHWDPDVDPEAFFDFSYHDFGISDLPAIIDYVLKTTEREKIPYVGFSEGTTQFFVMASEKPEYNEKISQANFWAPVTDMYRIACKPINFLAQVGVIEEFGKRTGLYELFPHATTENKIRALCRTSDWFCSVLFNLIGSSWQRMPNSVTKDRILENLPAGMSLKQLYHYVQGARSGVFRPFDYGSEENKLIYHKRLPDPYNISRLIVPTILYYGGSDIFVNNEILINNVATQLKNATLLQVPYDEFNHLDFMYSVGDDWLINTTLKNLVSIADQT